MKKILTHNGYSASINFLGAELISLTNPSGEEYIWQADPAFWAKHSPVLFPIVGTLKNNAYRYKNREYNLSRHGFAREMEFELTHHSENQAVFLLRYSDATLAKYPFRFSLQISYRLLNNALLIGYSVTNDGTEKMPFSLGAHPAFALPGEFADYALDFGTGTELRSYLLENDLLSKNSQILALDNHRLPLRYELFENDALIVKNVRSKSATILHRRQKRVTVSYDDFPHLGLWTKQGAPFLCIEPWFGYSDPVDATGNLMEKESISALDPSAVFNTNFTIEVF